MSRAVHLFLILIAAAPVHDSLAQAENNWWYFSNAAVDLGSVPPQVHTTSAMAQLEGSTSIASSTGDLLFYTDGVTVWNRNNSPMPNGSGLLGDYSAAQSALIVPAPGRMDLYYVFTVPSQSSTIPLAYSIVDMALDDGLGDLTLKNVPLLAGVTEGLHATLHANGQDRWVVTQRCSDLAIVSFRLTATGVDATPVISPAPPPRSTNEACYFGYLKIAPDGGHLCVTANYAEHAYLMAYDPTSGLASEPFRWKPFPMPPGSFFATSAGYGVEFSPGSTRLYLQSFSPRMLVQYDLLAGDTAAFRASRYMVDSVWLDPQDPTTTLYGGALQMAPNGRLYANRLNKAYLSAVTDPEALGAACGYVEHALDISPFQCQDGLPNHLQVYAPCCAVAVSPAPVPITMPNVFTPNGDGENDRFTPLIEGQVIQGSMDIYDRWGNLIFRTTNIRHGWDGTLHGRTCADDVYYYHLSFTMPEGMSETLAGAFSLFANGR